MMKEKNVEPLLVQYLLEKSKIYLPLPLIKHEAVIEIEEALRKEGPLFLNKVLKKFSTNIENFLEENKLDEFVKIIKQIKEKNKILISEDDEKIINFLVECNKNNKFFIFEVIAPLYFLSKVILELEEKKSLSKILRIFIIINSYMILYELILHKIDRILYNHLKDKKEYKKKYKKFFNIKREEDYEHATAGIINSIICDLLGLSPDNNSIFGGKSESRIFRNKIAHANVFYDEVREKIIISGKEYNRNDFLKLFFRLFDFSLKWLEKSFGTEIKDSKIFKDKIIPELQRYFNEFSKILLKIERSGKPRIHFMNLVISWKKEVGLK